MPENNTIELLFNLLIAFIKTHYWALLIFLFLIIWAYILSRCFSQRTQKYTSTSPPEKHWLMLQCIRWRRSSKQIIGAAILSLIISFLFFIMKQFVQNLLSFSNANNITQEISFTNQSDYILVIIFVALLSFKFRALWDVQSVLNDLKEANL